MTTYHIRPCKARTAFKGRHVWFAGRCLACRKTMKEVRERKAEK